MNLTYDLAVQELSANSDKAARAAKAIAATLLKPATSAPAPLTFPDRRTGPTKPGGFA